MRIEAANSWDGVSALPWDPFTTTSVHANLIVSNYKGLLEVSLVI